jgi:hypothetical protein
VLQIRQSLSVNEAWPDEAIVQQLVAQIPWYYSVRLLKMVKSPQGCLWYAQQTLKKHEQR